MSPRLFHLAAALLCSVALLSAQEVAPATAPAPALAKRETAPAKAETLQPPKPEAVPPYELKNRSVFTTTTEEARAPFWPIGWVKRKAGAVAQAELPAEPRVKLDEKSFKVTSILLGSGATPSLAVINGRAYSEGEFLRMPKSLATPPPRVRVQRINDGTVILQYADQTLVASLLRPELSNKRTEELVLDPDR